MNTVQAQKALSIIQKIIKLMQSEDILILGSGPQKTIAKKEFKKIYASNASIIKCKDYLSHNANIEIISVVTEEGLLSDIPTQKT